MTKKKKTKWVIQLNKGGYRPKWGRRTASTAKKARKYTNYAQANSTAVAVGGVVVEYTED